ncbi:WD repeat-containing protein 97 [Trichechus inunguis]
MESRVFGTGGPFPAEGDKLTLDLDLYDTDVSDAPDPGLLKERNESQLSETVQFLWNFTTSALWLNMTPRARARQLWLLLRTGLHDIVEKEKKAELCVECLTHGLEPLRRLDMAAGVRSVAQDPLGGRLVVLDGAGSLHLHREDGWAREKLRAPAEITGLVAMPGQLGHVGRFVGWGPSGLAILGPDLSLLWQSKPEVGRAGSLEPTCCLPVPDSGLLVVAQAGGGLELWKFRSGGRRLVPRGPLLQPPRSVAGALTRLALGGARSYCLPRCCAAYGSAVLTLDLRSWALVDVRRDLHKTTISDLAYCEEVKAMVTASRDSTVKVWEADWQIRTVFVGHTGPVTALAVLPNTALVLSASQDGTLRTWDLQAVAQVGEVALCSWGREVPLGRVSSLLAPASPGWPVLSLSAGGVELWRVRELYSQLAQLPAPVLHLQVAPALSAHPHPPLPARLVCACADGSVCLVSAITGRTVSALLLGPEDCAAAVAYCLPREALWLLTRAGHLVRANAARCPMRVLHRVRPPPAPAPRPCCLHLYSHLTDPGSARESWEVVREHGGELHRSDTAWALKDKNRYLPVVGHTDGALSVLEWRSSRTVFHMEAHSPGPVTAIASTWNSVVSSGGDLTVKMWRVFPYAEESLSLLRTISCCHPVVALCVLGKRVTVGFEAPATATYGLVQLNLDDHSRCDHRPQDDPTDHITGLCCCPTLKLYASSSLDCTIRIWTAENRLLRLLQLNGAPQALTFCSNSGDLVLALGSRLCLVPHRLYLPTSYLVKKLFRKAPEVVDDPPLPLTSQESLTSAQLQRLANLHKSGLVFRPSAEGNASAASVEGGEDFEALAARDRDLRRLRLGLVAPAARPPPSLQQRQEAFDNYLRLIYGPGLVGVQSGRASQQWSAMALSMERETWDTSTLPTAAHSLQWGGVCTEGRTVPAVQPPEDLGTLCQRLARPPRVTLPIPPVSRKVHSRASQLLAQSSLSCNLGLSLDLQLQSEHLRAGAQVSLEPSSSHKPKRIVLKRRPKELLSNLKGFFPATVEPLNQHRPQPVLGPVLFPGFVPNSVVLQRLWLQTDMGGLGALAQRPPERNRPKPGTSWDDLWASRGRKYRATWQQKLLGWLRGKPMEEQEDEEEEEAALDWVSASLGPRSPLSEEPLEPSVLEPEVQSLASESQGSGYARTSEEIYAHTGFHHGRSPWEEQYAHLPRFLHYFVGQNWFKKLFPIFTLEAYPEVGTVEGLASLLVDPLKEASWGDGVHILNALLRLLPDVSSDLRSRLQSILVGLLNLDPPPSLQDPTQKQFVMLALQLLLACSLESRDVVLELLSYFLYSPADCQPELKKLLRALGLQDPQGFLFKEMMTWVQDSERDSKALLRNRCGQKLEDMIQNLQMETWRPFAGRLSVELPNVSEPSELTPPKATLSQASQVSGPASRLRTSSRVSWTYSSISSAPSRVSETLSMTTLSAGLDLAAQERQTEPAQLRTRRTWRTLSDSLQAFCAVPEAFVRSSAPAALQGLPLPLEQTEWSHSQLLDLEYIDVLNFFCERQLERHQSSLPEEAEPESPSSRVPVPNTVVRQPPDRRYQPILRLQESRVQTARVNLRGRKPPWLCPGGPLRMLKLPLPRVEPQPFPPDWPAPARPRPPLLLQPALQRYFVPDDADPDGYS